MLQEEVVSSRRFRYIIIFQCSVFRTGDLYNAARDYLYVTQVWPDQRQAYIGLVKSLIALKWADEAQRWLEYFCSSHPDYANSPQVCTELRIVFEVNAIYT